MISQYYVFYYKNYALIFLIRYLYKKISQNLLKLLSIFLFKILVYYLNKTVNFADYFLFGFFTYNLTKLHSLFSIYFFNETKLLFLLGSSKQQRNMLYNKLLLYRLLLIETHNILKDILYFQQLFFFLNLSKLLCILNLSLIILVKNACLHRRTKL